MYIALMLLGFAVLVVLNSVFVPQDSKANLERKE